MNKRLFLLASFCDALFIASFLIVYVFTMQNAVPVLQEMSTISNNLGSADVLNDGSFNTSAALQLLELQKSLLKWIFLLFLLLFAAWILFEGLAHWMTWMQFAKTPFSYVRKFVFVSLPFYLFIVFAFWLSVFLSSLNAKLFIPLFTQGIVNFFVVMILLVVLYFWFYSLIIIRKKTLKETLLSVLPSGIMNFPKIMLSYLISLLIMALGLLAVVLLKNIDVILFYLGLIVFVMSVTYSRYIFFKRMSA